MPTETMPKEALTPEELRRQKEREYFKKYYQKNKEKIKKHDKEYKRKRYHSDPEFREKYLEARRRRHLEYREAYKRLKITLGGKCSVCGEDDLDVLEIHHPDGKEGRVFPLFIVRSLENGLDMELNRT